MSLWNVNRLLVFLLVLEVVKTNCQMPPEPQAQMFYLDDSLRRHARLRCLQQFPQAETVNFTASHETQCFLHCLLYKMGLMDLTTRGLDSGKLIEIWENIGEAFEEDNCLERFVFNEPLNGRCQDTYRKLMQFRDNCYELFNYIFNVDSAGKTSDPNQSKTIGQLASEFCDLRESENVEAKENWEEKDVSLMSCYKDKLKCIFENVHYLDAYGRVDETEILLSFQEAREVSDDSLAVVRSCVHKANGKYQSDYLGNTVFELQKCLKSLGAVFDKVFRQRDETSQQY